MLLRKVTRNLLCRNYEILLNPQLLNQFLLKPITNNLTLRLIIIKNFVINLTCIYV